MKNIALLFLITLSFPRDNHADISLNSNKKILPDCISNKKKTQGNLQIKIKKTPKIIRQLHIDGYINTRYVRLVVDIVNDKKLTGYLFDQTNSKQYIYGEKIKNVLHIYDPKGRHLTVVLDVLSQT